MNDTGGDDTGDDTGIDPGGLMFTLIEKGGELQGRLEEALGGVGLSLAKHGVLATLVAEGAPMALSELAARQKCVRSNITQLVDRLEDDGLVRREPDPADRRSIRAVLTAQGQARERAGTEEIRRVKAAFVGGIAAEDLEELGRLLKRME
jgi:DNA-binding MarR family transcriptional regulator